MLLFGMLDDRLSVGRGVERRPVQIAVTVVLGGDWAEYRTTTVDFSDYGLRLESDLTLSLFQHVGLLLATRPDHVIEASVAWMGRSDSAQSAQVGLKFLKPLQG
jgi:hypothetical protein